MLPEAVQLFFMAAQLFRAVFTLQVIVRVFRKTFREAEEGDFPPEEQDDGSDKKGPRIELSDKEEGREHHGIIPVIDSACAAALILQKPALKRAEEQNADHVAHGIGAGDEHHDALIKYAEHIEGAEHGVEADPDECHKDGGIVFLNGDVRSAAFDIVFCKLLLTAGAFQPGGEKPEHHFNHEDQPDDPQDDRPAFQMLCDASALPDPVGNINGEKDKEEQRSVNKPEIMPRAYGGQFHFLFFHLVHLMARPGFSRDRAFVFSSDPSHSMLLPQHPFQLSPPGRESAVFGPGRVFSPDEKHIPPAICEGSLS